MNINKPSDAFMTLPFVKAKTGDPDHPYEKRLRGFGWLPNKFRNHFIAWIGEFAGTFMFLFFAFSATQVANAGAAGSSTPGGSLSKAPNPSVLLYISLAFGFSLAVNVWVFFRISGGLFNPAVTFGMCLIGAVGWMRGLIVFLAQIVGSIAASAVVSALFPGELNVRTTLSGDTSIVRGLFIEMFLTFQLVFTIFMLAAEKHKGTFLAPIGIGLSLFIAELSGVFFTGGSLNPTRSFGPDVVTHTFNGYHWIYWLGPALGSLLAVVFYRIIKVLEYETANPGQDFDDKENEVFQPDEEPASAADVRRPNVSVGNSEYFVDESGIHSSPPPSSHMEDPGLRSGSQGKGRGRYDGSADPDFPTTNGRASRSKRGSSSAEAPPTGTLDSHNHRPSNSTRPYQNAPDAENGMMSSRF